MLRGVVKEVFALIREFRLFEDDGSLVAKTVRKGTMLGEGWFVMYKEAVQRLLKECPNFATFKVFIQLASYQTYDVYVYVSIRQVATDLGMTYRTAWGCVKWLEAHKYLRRELQNGTPVFLLNHLVTTCGKKSLPAKSKLWSIKLGGKVSEKEKEDSKKGAVTKRSN